MDIRDNEESSAGEWRRALTLLFAVLGVILFLYRETALSMAGIWARSDTFAHGFLVPPLSLWLIWRRRELLARLKPRPCGWMMPLLAVTGFAWLLGEMATVGPLSQFALVIMIVLAVPAFLGLHIARQILFPLGFLFFAVPFGEFAMPQLMEWTADVTVWWLRLSGIPVFREGLHFVIPSGTWSVVEACSGVRYLIASLMVGTLFAYLSYRSMKRRLIFVGVSFIVPVIANWLRAYMIVMLGHLSGNKLAAGIDHLIYGWLFFGIVIMAMFWIGSRWREDELPMAKELSRRAPEHPGRPAGSALAVTAMTLLVVAFWPFAEWQIERHAPADVMRIETLAPVPGWESSPEPLTQWKPRFANASAYSQTTYTAGGQKVGLYLAYYRNQGTERKLVTSTNDLVTSEDRSWIRVGAGLREARVEGRPLAVRGAELRASETSRLKVWQWYWINGRLTASDPLAKVYTALYRLAGQGDDSAVVIVYAEKDSAGEGDVLLQNFIDQAGPAIGQALQRTRDSR